MISDNKFKITEKIAQNKNVKMPKTLFYQIIRYT